MTESIRIPGYTLEDELGSGAMATVYQATQENLERKVALKLMAKHLAVNSEYHERFLNEAKNIAKLNHPNVITIHEVDVYDSHYYIAMEHLGGGTLQERIKQGITPDQALRITQQVAAALECAHRQQIVHRDVKPANILFRDDGTAVLSDFGIAKNLNNDANLTKDGLVIGTPAYLSPEQATGKPVDERSDLYALGIVFYEMLTGEAPYKSGDTTSLVMMHITAPIPSLPRSLSNYQRIVDRLMAKNPEDRFQTAAALIQAIDDLPSQFATALLPGAAPATATFPNPADVNATEILPSAQPTPDKTTRVSLKAIFGLLALLVIGSAAASFLLIPELKCLWLPIKLEVTYSYRVDGEDKLQPLTNDSVVNSGDHYKVQFRSAENAYVYIFQIDSSAQIYQLFPLQQGLGEATAANDNPVKADQTYFIPDKDKAFQLDDQVGSEHIHVLAFREQNKDLEQLVKQLESAREQQNSRLIEELQNSIMKLLQAGNCSDAAPLIFQHQ